MQDKDNTQIEYFDFSDGYSYYTPERMAHVIELINTKKGFRDMFLRLCTSGNKFAAARYIYNRLFDEPVGTAPPCTRCKHAFPRSDKCVFYQQGTEAAGIDGKLLDHRIPVEERCEYFEARQ